MDNNFQEQLDNRLSKIESLLLAQKTVLSLEEVVEYTGLSKSYVYKLTSSNAIPHFKPNGKLVYFERNEIEQWLMRNKVASSEERDQTANTYVVLGKAK